MTAAHAVDPAKPDVAASAFSQFFRDAAIPVDFTTEGIVILNNARRVLLVERGAVDLFAVRIEAGRPAGRWSFLCRVEQGGMLLGSPRGPRHTIIGRPVPGSHLSMLPVERFELLGEPVIAPDTDVEGGTARPAHGPAEPEYATVVRQFIRAAEAGVVALAQCLREQLAPRDFVPLERLDSTTIPAGWSARSVDGVRWVFVERGRVRVGDGVAGTLPAGEHVCLTERDWLIADEEAVLSSRSSAELLAAGVLWSLLVTHATRFLYTVDRRLERRDAAERDAITARVEGDAAAGSASARAFAAVVRDTQARVGLADVADDPAPLAAVRLVAARLDLPIAKKSAADGYGWRMDQVRRIASAAGIPTRLTRLAGHWWRRDLGPMIGYRRIEGAREEPVALLRDGTRYVYALPGENRVVEVNSRTARSLTDTAVVLYPPLPDRVRDTRALLRFGLEGGRRDLLTLLVIGVIVAALGLTVPIMTGLVLGNFVADARGDLVVQGSLLVIGAGVVAAVLSVVQNLTALRWQGRSATRLHAAIWSRVLGLPVSFFAGRSTGQLATMTLGVAAVQESLSSVLIIATLGALTGSANLILVYVYDVRLAVIATLFVIVSVVVCLVAGRLQLRPQRAMDKQEQKLASLVFQLLTGLPKVRVAAAEDRAFALWAADFVQTRRHSAAARRTQNFVSTFNAAFPLVCSAVIFALVGGPLRGTVSVTTFLAFFTAFSLLMASTLQFTGVAITAMSAVPMFERLRPLLEAVPEAATSRLDPGDLSGRIALSSVSFRYGEDSPLVLDDVSFTVEPGEFVAVVGPTGCGKSTILRLLLGFERPTMGSVLYDGRDLAGLETAAVRRQCGVVLQHGALLAGDIKTNIVGSTSHSLEDAWEAARMAGIDGEIAAMPMGMHTMLSEGTNTLSGGQRQRIMIARALVAKPRLVFLDEATSALDNPVQRMVADATRRLNATRIVIAHRLSTVVEADRIIVLDSGRIVQQGTYDELLADPDGLFARLASRQVA
jgi:NHLM bacteriocin system ABC transporter ATP-binding protein